MAIIDANFNPSNRQLRQFGAVCLVALPLVVWLWTRSAVAIGGAGAAGIVLCIVGIVAPTWLKPVFIALTIVTLPIGLVAGEVTLLLLYFGLFFPMSILMRIAGRDSLQRRSPADADTFWQKRKPPSGIRSYYQQF